MKTLMFVCALAWAVSTASAIPTNITVDTAGALLNGTGVANKTQYGQGNNNPTSNLNFLNTEIDRWNTFNPDLPDANSPVALNAGSLSGATYAAVAGFDYVVFHFGGGNAHSPGGWWQAFYLGGNGWSFVLPTVGGNTVGGFSSARYYNPHTSVPDGGATVMLLGTAFGLIAAARRKFDA